MGKTYYLTLKEKMGRNDELLRDLIWVSHDLESLKTYEASTIDPECYEKGHVWRGYTKDYVYVLTDQDWRFECTCVPRNPPE